LSSRSGAPFRIDSVDIKNTGLSCEYKPGLHSNAKLRFKGKVSYDKVLLDNTIDVKTFILDSNQSFKVQIPVYAYLRTNQN